MEHRLLIHGSEFAGSYTFQTLEVFDHVAAIGITGLLTDIGKIHIGEQQVVLYLGNAHTGNVFLAADAVQLTKFFGKPGVAHSAERSKILYANGLTNVPVDMGGDRIDRGQEIGLIHLFLYNETFTHPATNDIGTQNIQMRSDHDIKAVAVILIFTQAYIKYRVDPEGTNLIIVKMKRQSLLFGIEKYAFNIRSVCRCFVKLIQVHFDHIVIDRIRIRRVDRVRDLGGDKVGFSVMKDGRFIIAPGDGDVSAAGKNDLGKIMPVTVDGKRFVYGIVRKALKWHTKGI